MNKYSYGSELPEENTASKFIEPFKSIDVPRIALESANVGIWIMDPASRKFLPSTRTKELFGFLPEEEMSFQDTMLKVADKHRKIVAMAIDNALKNKAHLILNFLLPYFLTTSMRSSGFMY